MKTMEPEERIEKMAEILGAVENGTLGREQADDQIMAMYSAAGKELSADVHKVASYALEWIDAVPDQVVATLHTMPGFDRDWADSVLDKAKRVLEQQNMHGRVLTEVAGTEPSM
jgi:hypothetical protein